MKKDLNLIELKNVNKFFSLDSGREFQALKSISLKLHQGEVLALLGPSGSGKSTCLRIMCGLLDPSDGEVFSGTQKLKGINLDVAMVFQNFALLPWESVYQNIILGLESLPLSYEKKKEAVKKVIDIVGLEGFEEAYPRELSGGMKQRVGLARAMAMQRSILFLDEPFSALDVLTSETLRQEILKIYYNNQTTIRSMLLVTHNIQEAVLMADRILVLGSNPGHIKEEFANNLNYPRSENDPKFIDLVKRIHACITESYMPDSVAMTEETKKNQPEILPPVSMLEIIGLIEAIKFYSGTVDLFLISEEVGGDFGHTLYLVKAAELLGLVDTPKQKVILTDLAQQILISDINERKKILNAEFSKLHIVDLVDQILKETKIFRISNNKLCDKIQELFPREDAHKILQVLIDWGRYTEHYGYNDDTKTIYLDIGQEDHLS